MRRPRIEDQNTPKVGRERSWGKNRGKTGVGFVMLAQTRREWDKERRVSRSKSDYGEATEGSENSLQDLLEFKPICRISE